MTCLKIFLLEYLPEKNFVLLYSTDVGLYKCLKVYNEVNVFIQDIFHFYFLKSIVFYYKTTNLTVSFFIVLTVVSVC